MCRYQLEQTFCSVGLSRCSRTSWCREDLLPCSPANVHQEVVVRAVDVHSHQEVVIAWPPGRRRRSRSGGRQEEDDVVVRAWPPGRICEQSREDAPQKPYCPLSHAGSLSGQGLGGLLSPGLCAQWSGDGNASAAAEEQ
jgi:hypothetical protein